MIEDTHTTLITGGASGIGLATAEAFASSGGNVVVADLGADEGEEVAADVSATHDGDAVVVETDVSEERDVEQAVAAASDRFGGLDGVVNNAPVAALVSLTRSISVEYAPEIRANAVCPGVIETPMIDRTPLPTGQPEDVGSVVAVPASGKARYVTGAVLPVDGGYTAR